MRMFFSAPKTQMTGHLRVRPGAKNQHGLVLFTSPCMQHERNDVFQILNSNFKPNLILIKVSKKIQMYY